MGAYEGLYENKLNVLTSHQCLYLENIDRDVYTW